jgi:hypothetical protein
LSRVSRDECRARRDPADYPIPQGAIESLIEPAIAQLTRGDTAAKTHPELRSRAAEILDQLDRATKDLPVRGMAKSELAASFRSRTSSRPDPFRIICSDPAQPIAASSSLRRRHDPRNRSRAW